MILKLVLKQNFLSVKSGKFVDKIKERAFTDFPGFHWQHEAFN